MRVTDRMMFTTASERLARQESNLQLEMARLSSGRAVDKPSDDPVRYEQGRLAAEQRAMLQAYALNSEQALGAMDQVDQALAGMQNALQRVLELTVQGASEQFTQDKRDAMALEVEALQQEFLGLGNTRLGGRYLLGGTLDTTPPFASDGSYQGSSVEVSVEVAPGMRAATRLDGGRLLATGAGTLFGVVADVAGALRSGDTTALSGAVVTVQQAVSDLATTQAEVGSHDSLAAQASAILQADTLQNEVRADRAVATDVAASSSRLALTLRSLQALQQVLQQTLSVGLLDL
ncbi:MAG: hypothetical protein ABIJ09_17915 [Pseudomonadota bacterium]